MLESTYSLDVSDVGRKVEEEAIPQRFKGLCARAVDDGFQGNFDFEKNSAVFGQ